MTGNLRVTPPQRSSRPALRLAFGPAVAALFCALLLAPPSHAASSKKCVRMAKAFEKAKRVRPLDAARKLRRLHDKDPACFEAPEAAYSLLERVWPIVTPKAERGVPPSTVERQWNRYKNWAAFAQAIAAFRLGAKRADATLALGKIHEGFSSYLDEVGNVPGNVVVIREVPESLYHTRAVDVSEYLKIQAESSYDLVTRLLVNASRDNEVLVEAEERLSKLRGRYSERLAAQRAAEAARAAKKGEEEGAEEPLPAP